MSTMLLNQPHRTLQLAVFAFAMLVLCEGHLSAQEQTFELTPEDTWKQSKEIDNDSLPPLPVAVALRSVFNAHPVSPASWTTDWSCIFTRVITCNLQ